MNFFKKNKSSLQDTNKQDHSKDLIEYQNVNPNPNISKEEAIKTKNKQIIIVVCTSIITLIAIAAMVIAIVFCL